MQNELKRRREAEYAARRAAAKHTLIVALAFIVGGFFGYYIGVEQATQAALEMLGR